MLALLAGGRPGVAWAQRTADRVPVGVFYQSAPDPARQRRDLEEMQRLRFTVVAVDADIETPDPPLFSIDALLAGAAMPRFVPPDVRPAAVSVGPSSTAGEVHARAWAAFARAGGVLFADWTTLLANPDALGAAADVAGAFARNAALYAPLRPLAPGAARRTVAVHGGGTDLAVTLLESADALVLVAVNLSARSRTATLSFSPEVPEAIWQNMLTGGAVNFVAGPAGPVYERTFAPHEAVVLMIRSRVR